MPDAPQPAPAGLGIRLLALVYEVLLLAALLFVATALFMALAGTRIEGALRHALQVYLAIVAAGYFVWSWTGGRRTLAMRTWRLRLVDRAGGPLRPRAALLRFGLAAITLPPLLAGAWWSLFDRDRQFLYDRLAGTRVVRDPPPRAARAGR